ncbi:MAG: FecR domain-containing protein [Cytophagales bacterium]|nr:FecR domain-containing protein [Cytophagales bacterium]
MEHHNIDQIILTYLQGKATTREIEILKDWIREDKDREDIFEATKRYWERSALEVKSPDLDQAYLKLKMKSTKDIKERAIGVYKSSRSWKDYRYGFVAILIAFFTLAAMVYFMGDFNRSVSDHDIARITTEEIKKENPKGQKLTTYLPDGSKVILNSQSKITYQKAFAGSERLIELEGEAFFEVKKDPKKPFKVVANGISTTALGTSFNVNSKSGGYVEVALVSGKVQVSDGPDNSVILDPGEFAIASQNEEVEVMEFDYLDMVGWKDGILVFNDDSLPEIIARVEDWYGVKFISAEELLEQDFHYTGTYKNETLEEVLHGISFVHHFKFKITGDTVKILAN